MPTTAKAQILHGESLFERGDYKGALAAFEAALATAPSDANALNDAALASEKLGRLVDAADYFERALEAQPDHGAALFGLVDLLVREEEVDLAREAFAAYEGAVPESAEKRRYAAALLPHRGDGAPAPTAAPYADLSDRLLDENQDTALNVAFVCGPDQKFIGAIEEKLAERHRVRSYHFAEKVDPAAIQAAMDWADVTWFEWCDQILIHASQHLNKTSRVVCRLHGYEVFAGYPSQVEWAFVDQLVFVAQHKLDLFAQQWPGARVEKTVIRNGVNLDRFRLPAQKRNTKNLVLLGNLNYRKGLPLLMQFYSELLRQDDAYHLYIRGQWQDLRYRMAIETMIGELDLADHVTFATEWIEDLNAWLEDKSHILSFSLEESFHYAVGEAMAAGLKPVIHAWRESRALWPAASIFRNLDEFLAVVSEDVYEPQVYRRYIAEHYASPDWIAAIDSLLTSLSDSSSKGETSDSARLADPETQLDAQVRAQQPASAAPAVHPGSRKKHLLIVAQPRSGTTIMWKTLRQDTRLVCYDEPFRPHLRSYVTSRRNDKKGTITEYLERPELVARHWSTILPYEEALPQFVAHQADYLRALLGTGSNVCIDFIRCNARIRHLREIAPEAFIVHLVRDPRAWVTSHLRPYGKWLPGLPGKFFEHDGWFDFWHRQSLAQALSLKGYAHEQLLQIWNHLVTRAENDSPDLTLTFEQFASAPADTLGAIYDGLALDLPDLDVSSVRLPNPPHALADPAWDRAIETYLSSENHTFLAARFAENAQFNRQYAPA